MKIAIKEIKKTPYHVNVTRVMMAKGKEQAGANYIDSKVAGELMAVKEHSND